MPETESALKKINFYVQKLEKLVSVLLENNKFGLQTMLYSQDMINGC